MALVAISFKIVFINFIILYKIYIFYTYDGSTNSLKGNLLTYVNIPIKPNMIQ